MGWSWYTGSAAWGYKLVIEYFYGLKRRGDRLFIEPRLPKRLNNSTLTYRYNNSSYIIEYRMGKAAKTTVDGQTLGDDGGISLESGRRSRILVEVET
jgi:cyclic beta-1,2-glucan synthetase